MITPILSYLLLLAILLGCSAFFSASETTLFSLNRSQIAKFKKRKTAGARQVLKFLSEPKSVLVTILFGNELVNISFSILIANLVYLWIGAERVEQATLISVGIGTLLLLVFGEILPKNIAIRKAATFAPAVAMVLKPLHAFTKPFRLVMVRFANFVTRIFGANLEKEPPMIVDEEFRHLIELGAKTGQVDPEERELIHKAFEFEQKRADQIMTPISSAFCLDIDLPFETLLEEIKATQFSRIPMCEKSRDNMIGYLYVKDLLQFNIAHQKNLNLTLREILRKPLSLNRKSSLETVLQGFRDNKIHMAILVDEKQKPVGLITMHDVIEALFGEVEP